VVAVSDCCVDGLSGGYRWWHEFTLFSDQYDDNKIFGWLYYSQLLDSHTRSTVHLPHTNPTSP
jgi:hypothetical protein